jgi:hypothetical protein
MFIGSNSKSTVLDVFRTGVKELIRQVGHPTEVKCTTTNAEVIARSADFGSRVDVLRVAGWMCFE